MHVHWKYESKGFKLVDTYFFPDFFIKELNEWHEVKGYMSTVAQGKIDMFKEGYPEEKLVLIEDSEIKEIKKLLGVG